MGDTMDLNRFFILFAMLLLAPMTYVVEAAASDAALQVTDYSLVPQNIYPGSKGYIQLTISNTGSDTATGITVQYSNNFDYKLKSQSTGDINSNSNSQISVPFQVSTDFSSGVLLYKIEIYYQSSQSGGESKLTTYSIPIIVSQNEILEVNTLSLSKKTISPGEKVSVELEIRNIGGTINNLAITSQSDSSFSIDGSTRKSVGNLPSNSTKVVTLNLASSSLTVIGQYMVPLTFTYEDSLQNTVTQTLQVGPVSVLESSTQFRVTMDPLTYAEVGSQATFYLQLENTGSDPISAIVDISSTNTFIPLGSNRIYFDSVEPGKKVSENVTLGISASAASGYYELPFTVTLSSGQIVSQKVGVVVQATPEITLTAESSQSTTGNDIVLQISNTGNSPIRSVYVTAEYGGTKTEKFIGTLDLDDYSTMTLNSGSMFGMRDNTTQRMAPKINVMMSFRDEQNQQHTLLEEVSISTRATSSTATSIFTTRQRTNNDGLFGFSWIQIGAGILLVAAGYYLYRRSKKKK